MTEVDVILDLGCMVLGVAVALCICRDALRK